MAFDTTSFLYLSANTHLFNQHLSILLFYIAEFLKVVSCQMNRYLARLVSNPGKGMIPEGSNIGSSGTTIQTTGPVGAEY
jgi:hypothetical protein